MAADHILVPVECAMMACAHLKPFLQWVHGLERKLGRKWKIDLIPNQYNPEETECFDAVRFLEEHFNNYLVDDTSGIPLVVSYSKQLNYDLLGATEIGTVTLASTEVNHLVAALFP